MFLFHIEDRIGLDPIKRDYGMLGNIEIPLNGIHTYIADEIGAEINGRKLRKIFSCSKSLGIDLFKYNLLADNPIHIINLNQEQRLNTVVYKKSNEYRRTKYDINCFDYSKKSKLSKNNSSIILLNYIIDVSNNEKLDQYLRHYSTEKTGIKARISPERDKEVMIRHVDKSEVIEDEYEIAAIFLIYALQYKTGFLADKWVFDSISHEWQIVGSNAFSNTLLHMKYHIESEKEDYKLIHEYAIGKLKTGYDAYDLAYDIITADLLDNDALQYISNLSDSYIHYGIVESIWKIFYQWWWFHEC